MKLATFSTQGKTAIGAVLDDERVVLFEGQSSMLDFIGAGPGAVAMLQSQVRQAVAGERDAFVKALNDVQLLAPIPRPRKNVFCVGRNYLDHVKEGQRAMAGHQAVGTSPKVPEYPQYFTKAPTAVIGTNATVRLDSKVTRKLDYEVELALVIGKAGRDIPESEALSHVFGYTILNDVTARDVQRQREQWFKGKSLDTTCPTGPWIVHASAIVNPQDLDLSMKINGEVRQKSNTSNMIFNIAKLISDLSSGLTLEPGDILSTGTPEGVGFAMNPPVYLANGDVMECEIEGIGVLRNTIEAV